MILTKENIKSGLKIKVLKTGNVLRGYNLVGKIGIIKKIDQSINEATTHYVDKSGGIKRIEGFLVDKEETFIAEFDNKLYRLGFYIFNKYEIVNSYFKKYRRNQDESNGN